MKPKDLKPPFTWEDRKVVYNEKERLLFVPDYYSDYDQFPQLNFKKIFGNSKPVFCEYCSGNGDWLIAKALNQPDINWIACEKRFDRVRKIWSKMHNHNLSNVFIICGEAHTSTHYYIPSQSFSQVFINFPDPWPKERHAKHRLIKPAFIEELSRALKEKSTITVTTDDHNYSEAVIAYFLAHKQFAAVFNSPYYTGFSEEYGRSYFYDLWKELGRQIRLICFQKKQIQVQT